MSRTLLQPPKLMPLPAALRYAREGYAIRRAIWDGSGEDRSLAWIVYRGGLFFLLDGEGREVVQNDEVSREDFLAQDWTLLPPECVSSAEVCACGPGALDAMPYPEWEDEPDPMAPLDGLNPNSLLGLEGCEWRTGPCECGGGGASPPPWFVPPGNAPPGTSPLPVTPSSPAPGGGTTGGTGGPEPSGGSSISIGSGGGGGSPNKPPRKPRTHGLPNVTLDAQVTDPSCIPRLPEQPCGNLNLPDNSLQSRSVAGTISIGPHPEGRRDLCWITVTCGGQTLLRQIGAPGDSFDYGPGGPFRQPADGSMPVSASVHFPGQHGGTKTARAQADWPPLCAPQGPCTPPPPPPPPPDPSGPMY